MIPSDDTIRGLLHIHRMRHSEEDPAAYCPFPNIRDNCLICKHVVEVFPHIHALCKNSKEGYHLFTGNCPCMLYGEEYVTKKVMEFMGEWCPEPTCS